MTTNTDPTLFQRSALTRDEILTACLESMRRPRIEFGTEWFQNETIQRSQDAVDAQNNKSLRVALEQMQGMADALEEMTDYMTGMDSEVGIVDVLIDSSRAKLADFEKTKKELQNVVLPS